ncbi:MAG: permease-like cell division protein FtsX [Patescibacteria group bacterium]
MTKTWENLKYYLNKEKLMTVSHFLVMGITFLLLGIFINIIVLSQTALKYLEDQAQITIFFKDEFGEDKILPVKGNLEKDSRIGSINYVSKEEALRIFKEINKDEPVLLESISASVLPASLEVKAKNIGDLDNLTDEFKSMEGVEEVRFYKDVVSRFRSISTAVYIVGFVLVVSFFVISYSVIISALRTTINSRGQELEIMKLVGASDSYVRNPFIYQGVFFSLISAASASIVMMLFGVAMSKISVFSKGLSLGFIPGFYMNPIIFSLVLSCILLLSGFMLGYFGSNAAIKKYLKY